MSDPISNLLVSLKNAGKVGRESVVIPYSELKFKISELLLKNGFLSHINVKGKKGGKVLEIGLAYDDGKISKISEAKRVSKLSKRVYLPYRRIRSGIRERKVQIISTPKGLLTQKEAIKEKVGGE